MEWAKLTVAVLKEKLKERGLATTGKKAELVARLEDWSASQATVETEPAGQAAAKDPSDAADEPVDDAAANEELEELKQPSSPKARGKRQAAISTKKAEAASEVFAALQQDEQSPVGKQPVSKRASGRASRTPAKYKAKGVEPEPEPAAEAESLKAPARSPTHEPVKAKAKDKSPTPEPAPELDYEADAIEEEETLPTSATQQEQQVEDMAEPAAKEDEGKAADKRVQQQTMGQKGAPAGEGTARAGKAPPSDKAVQQHELGSSGKETSKEAADKGEGNGEGQAAPDSGKARDRKRKHSPIPIYQPRARRSSHEAMESRPSSGPAAGEEAQAGPSAGAKPARGASAKAESPPPTSAVGVAAAAKRPAPTSEGLATAAAGAVSSAVQGKGPGAKPSQQAKVDNQPSGSAAADSSPVAAAGLASGSAPGAERSGVPRNVGPPSRALRIDKFVRPFREEAAKQLMQQTGTVVDFWMPNIRTHCYVIFETEEQATATLDATYNLGWPKENNTRLAPKYVPEQEARDAIDVARGTKVAGLNVGGKEEGKSGTAERKEQRVSGRGRQPDLDKQPAAAAANGTAAAEALSLDDLFRKTEAKPCIYWLPLTDEQVARKKQRQAAAAVAAGN